MSTLAGAAYVAVRERILRGDIPLGHAISRRRVAAELGMSFLPITEAMQRLELEGLVESRPRSGTRVCLPSRERLLEHHVVRAALESQAAMRFSQLARRRERVQLRELAERLDGLEAGDDGGAWVALHRQVHGAIATGAHCRPLTIAIERATGVLQACAMAGRHTAPRPQRVAHAALAEVVGGTDPAAARQALCDHLEREMNDTLRSLEPHFRRPPALPRRVTSAA